MLLFKPRNNASMSFNQIKIIVFLNNAFYAFDLGNKCLSIYMFVKSVFCVTSYQNVFRFFTAFFHMILSIAFKLEVWKNSHKT